MRKIFTREQVKRAKTRLKFSNYKERYFEKQDYLWFIAQKKEVLAETASSTKVLAKNQRRQD